MIAFIRRIRQSDMRTKWKWLIIFTSISMVIVIIIWMAALHVITANIENPEKTPVATDSVSFFEKIKISFNELLYRTGVAARNVKSKIAGNDIPLDAPQLETSE